MAGQIYGFVRKDVQRIRRVVRRVEGSPTSPTGPRPVPSAWGPEFVSSQNIDSLAAPQYGLVWLKEYDAPSRKWLTRRPMYPGISMVGISSGALGVRASGIAWTRGPKVRKLLCDDYTGLAIGDRVGAQKASWYGAFDELGPFVVHGAVPAAEQPAGLPADAGLVLVVITGERGDEIVVRDGNGGMVASAVLAAPSHTVSQTTFGETIISD